MQQDGLKGALPQVKSYRIVEASAAERPELNRSESLRFIKAT